MSFQPFKQKIGQQIAKMSYRKIEKEACIQSHTKIQLFGDIKKEQLQICWACSVYHNLCAVSQIFPMNFCSSSCKGYRFVFRMPINKETMPLKQQFGASYSPPNDISAVVYVLKLPMQQSEDTIFQELVYNGWVYGNLLSNLFSFALNGFTAGCEINVLGSVLDSFITVCGDTNGNFEPLFVWTRGLVVIFSTFLQGGYLLLPNISPNEHSAPWSTYNSCKQRLLGTHRNGQCGYFGKVYVALKTAWYVKKEANGNNFSSTFLCSAVWEQS